ncbi:MAG TPA: DNA polymerase III subunit gamma/tau, partial [Gammaproteobacteria bacterium]|nr:DNA polymerase III subunit gamma/tau [Gammaproteobacteria bacterium]
MSYQVLARKWRPRTFGEMVGQEHVLQALINALDRDRLHHAYLFTGTRGVGKTTVARIFAKSLNCEQGVGSTPCGECSACTEIDEGRFVDLIEVDAASRTKVEDTRELLDNVQYAPTRGRYKVYLIDEVHMLSAHSFNALLKTLEEPPPHVKFLLATTDPQKLPATVLSRCLQFNLKRLAPELIADYLAKLLEQESIEAEPAALKQLARAADGSMRDALSLLDQAIAHGGGRVIEAEVRAMLGTLDQGQVVEMLQALAAGDAAAVLAAVAAAGERAPDYEALLAELLGLLQQVAIAQQVPEALDDNLDAREAVLELAGRMPPEDVQLYYQIGLIGRRDLPLAPDLRGGLEMVLLRMLAFRPQTAGEAPAAGPARSQPAQPRPGRPRSSAAGAARKAAPDTGAAALEPEAEPAAAPRAAPQAPIDDDGSCDWIRLVEQLPLKGVLRELAMNCACRARDGDHWQLVVDPAHEQLLSAARRKRLAECLGERLGRPVRL